MAYFIILVCCLQISAKWVSAITSQCHCNDCKVFPDNPCPMRQGSTRCKPNWFGTFCQKENIAFNKPTSQSSAYSSAKYGGPFLAGFAVDGNTDNDFNHNSCSHTDDTNTTGAWWKVTLNPNEQYNISHITVYLRSGLRDRNDGFQLKVNNQVCPTQYNEEKELNINCHSMPGNEVTIQITGPWLTLCEVQVFICSDGWFGDDCDKQCQCRNKSEICDKDTGYCRSGCRAGRQGESCQDCNDGYYGYDCSSECGHCLNGPACDRNSGHCDQNCRGQFKPPLCKVCADGYYGEDCSSECGHCENGYGCNKTTGHCDRNCDRHFQPPFCKSCIAGKYGENCSMSCGQCRNNSECHKTTGICPNGCSRGYIQPFCIKECVDYTHGDNCSGVCSCLNQYEVCDKVTGSCHTGYQPTTSTTSTSSATSTAACTCTAQTIGLSVMGSLLTATCTSLAVMVLKYIKIKRRLTKNEAEKNRQYSTLRPGNTPIYDVITDSHQFANDSINVQENQL